MHTAPSPRLLPLLGLLCLSSAASAVTYTYTGASYNVAAGTYASATRVEGQFTVASQLPALAPSTDISAQVTGYSFFDGVQTLTPPNSKILAFFVTTGTGGNVIHWGIAIWATPVTTMVGGPVAGINLDSVFVDDAAFTDAPCTATGGPGGECSSIIDLEGGTNYARSRSQRGTWTCDDCVAAGVPVARLWAEAGDAPSFPDNAAQITRGQAALTAITGATNAAGGDLRDAFCVRVTDPLSFLATTDPATDPAASSAFDSRLFLFRPDSAPRLAHQDLFTPGATLTGQATDGSGFFLGAGEYVLIVAGDPDDPRDASDTGLFDIESSGRVHGPNPAAGRFDHWEGGMPQSGAYTVVLFGAGPCQGDLDAVFANEGTGDRLCLGDDGGGFACRDVSAANGPKSAVALGFVDGDAHLDAVFAVDGLNPNRICLGNGAGGFDCATVNEDLDSSRAVSLGDVNGDGALDAVFANVLSDGGGNNANRVCFGDGGGLGLCSDVSADDNLSRGVALGFLDGDTQLDAVFANDGAANRACLGDGSGGFVCADVEAATDVTTGVALGRVNGDPHPDAVFANDGTANRTCLGNGFGGFAPCSNVSADANATAGVALGLVNADDELDAVFANSGQRNRVCFGDGAGGFSTCSDVGTDTHASTGVALGLVNGDAHLDAVFANQNQRNRVCFGDGAGGFSCSDMTEIPFDTRGVALGEVAPQRIFSDGFESGDAPP